MPVPVAGRVTLPPPGPPPGAISMVPTIAEPATPPPVQTVSPNEIEMQRAMAAALMKNSQQPVGHWTEGVANIADALVGGLTARKAGERETAALESENAADTFAAGQGGDLLARVLMGEKPSMEELSGVLSNPRAGGYAGPLMEMMKPKSGGEGFTLSPGQQRFDAAGNPVAGVPDEPPEAVADIREFEDAKRRGWLPKDLTYEEFKVMDKAPVIGSINTTDTADAAEAKKKGEARVAHFAAIADDLPAADTLAQSVTRLEQLLQGVDPGSEAGVVNWVRDMTGLELTDDAGKLQAVSSMVDYLTPRMRVPGSGATSDMEMRTFKNSLPGLMGTPDGNRIIIETLKGLAERRVDMASIARDYLIDALTAEEATKQMRALPDPFAAFKGGRAADTLGGPAAPAPAGTATPAEVEAELKRRGLIPE